MNRADVPAAQASPRDDQAEVPGLTGLRFLAALAVALAHAAALSFRTTSGSEVQHWLEVGAGFGMTLFFVLSGFVIHYNYSRKISPAAGLRGLADFLWARFARLYPLYILAIFIEILFSNVINSAIIGNLQPLKLSLTALPSYLTLTQSWVYWVIDDRVPIYAFGTAIPATWSISTEWFFYLCYPALLLMYRPLRSVSGVLVCALLWCAVWGGAIVYSSRFWLTWDAWAVEQFGYLAGRGRQESFIRWLTYFSPYARIGEFILGNLVAQLFLLMRGREVSAGERRAAPWLVVAAVLTIIVSSYVMFADTQQQWILTSWIRPLNNNFGLAPPIAVLIFCVARYRVAILEIFKSKPALSLGEASYSIYLIHLFVFFPAMARAPEPLPNDGLVSHSWSFARLRWSPSS